MKINQLSIATFAVLLLGSSLVAQQPEANPPAQGTDRQQQCRRRANKGSNLCKVSGDRQSGTSHAISLC
jgi:hypothetical protein